MLLPLLITTSALLAIAHPSKHAHNPAQAFFADEDDLLHPDWVHRQSALGGWAGREGEDAVSEKMGGGVGGCGGVCVLTPESMEGPFYTQDHLIRSNITESHPGIPLELTIHLYQISSSLSSGVESVCEPLPGAWADIWSCDITGVYSGYGNATGPPPGGPPGGPPHRRPKGPGGPGRPPMHAEPINNSTFLRGIQPADPTGKVTFHSVFPGWYRGRTTHLHLKIHPPSWLSPTELNSTHTHTTQLFFPSEFNDHIASLPPYNENRVQRTRNEEDGIYREMKGLSVVRAVYKAGGKEGIKAEIAVGVDKWW